MSLPYGFARSGDVYLLRLSAEEAQAVGLVIAQVAGLIQAGSRRGGGPSPAEADPGDPFDQLVAGLGAGLGTGAGSAAGSAPGEPRSGSPDDPVLARLFPDGYRDDPEAAAELRSLTEGSLRAQKIENAAAVLDDLPLEGGEVRLDAERAEAWLLALNDARLMLGTVLDIDADTDLIAELDAAAGADPTGSRVLGFALYQLLTTLQASLIEVIDPA